MALVINVTNLKYGKYDINELTRNEIASLILGVLDAEMCRAKYKYKYDINSEKINNNKRLIDVVK